MEPTHNFDFGVGLPAFRPLCHPQKDATIRLFQGVNGLSESDSSFYSGPENPDLLAGRVDGTFLEVGVNRRQFNCCVE